MKTYIVLLPLWLLTTLTVAQRAGKALEGCPAPSQMASHLAELQHRNWQTISAEQIIKIWPAPLDEVVCQGTKRCRLLVSKERVISGHCQCCETFAFDLEDRHSEPAAEHLNNVIIHFSATTREEVISAARVLAESIGLSKPDIGRIDDKAIQRFEWADKKDSSGQSYLLELQLTPEVGHWELFLSLSANKS
jgi:hypothetical protein